MNKRLLGSFLACLVAAQVMAQESSTLSPYSQYGLGILADQSLGYTRGMGGLGVAMRNGHQVNMINPASFSAVDSLTMLFDIGMATKISNFKENGKKVNARTGALDYLVASFRLLKNVGLGVGIVPFSNIGYDYESIDNTTGNVEAYTGDGGFSQVFLGLGWEFAKGFSAGFNISYLWGNYEKDVLVTNSDANSNILLRSYSTTIRNYKLDFGLQWQHLLNKDNLLTLGATMSVGHNLHAKADVETVTTNSTTGTTSTSNPIVVENAYSMPWMYGFGASLLHKNRLTVGADYTLQRWGALDYPVYDSRGYTMSDNVYQDRHKVAGGLDWTPNPMSRKYFSHVHYRFGISYATPYYKIKGGDGPSELSISAGFGLPISRSMIHISGQWMRTSASGFITDNTFRINVGLTFNERWFAKWKVD